MIIASSVVKTTRKIPITIDHTERPVPRAFFVRQGGLKAALTIGFTEPTKCGSKHGMYRTVLIASLATAAIFHSGCKQSGPGAGSEDVTTSPPLTAATLGEQTILAPRDYLAQDLYASADTGRGEALTMQCRACHTLERGGASIVGPNLFGVFGRIAGTAADFAYSDVLAAGDFVWTPRALDAWLAQPFAFLPGNRMSFPGLPNASDRNAVIAYLLQQTGNGGNNGGG